MESHERRHDFTKRLLRRFFFKDGGTVTNDTGGVIAGDSSFTGVRLEGAGSDTVINAGSMSGRNGVWVSGANNFIRNTGTITGTNAGAVVTGTNGTIENSGTIKSTLTGPRSICMRQAQTG